MFITRSRQGLGVRDMELKSSDYMRYEFVFKFNESINQTKYPYSTPDYETQEAV